MDKAAFSAEAQRLRPTLLAIARRYVADGDEAEDIVQDALLKLWQLCPTLQLPIDALAAVLTHNLSKDHLRRRRPTTDLTDGDLGTNEAEQETSERYLHIMQIIDTLPPLPQLVVRMRHVEGMEFADIAQLTGTTEAAVRKAVSRARKAIRDKYLKTEAI